MSPLISPNAGAHGDDDEESRGWPRLMGQRTSEVELGQVRVRPRAAPAWARPLLIYSLVVCKCAWRLPLCTSTCVQAHTPRDCASL